MNVIALSVLVMFPSFAAIDPCSVELPTESHLLEDSLPVAVFYSIGGGILLATAATYMVTR